LTTPRQSRGRAVPFAEHRDALAAMSQGLREARCVLEATVQVFGSVEYMGTPPSLRQPSRRYRYTTMSDQESNLRPY
jgi:hypothetical protein